MINEKLPHWENIHTIIFDFDGIFTDNHVIVSQDGTEAVCCSREDSLGIDILKRFIRKRNWEVEIFILSTEKNNVVLSRSEKLKIKCAWKKDKDGLEYAISLSSNNEKIILCFFAHSKLSSESTLSAPPRLRLGVKISIFISQLILKFNYNYNLSF